MIWHGGWSGMGHWPIGSRTCTTQLRVVINKTLSPYQPGSRTNIVRLPRTNWRVARHSANVNGVPTRRRMVSSRLRLHRSPIGASDRLMWSGHKSRWVTFSCPHSCMHHTYDTCKMYIHDWWDSCIAYKPNSDITVAGIRPAITGSPTSRPTRRSAERSISHRRPTHRKVADKSRDIAYMPAAHTSLAQCMLLCETIPRIQAGLPRAQTAGAYFRWLYATWLFCTIDRALTSTVNGYVASGNVQQGSKTATCSALAQCLDLVYRAASYSKLKKATENALPSCFFFEMIYGTHVFDFTKALISAFTTTKFKCL